LSLKLPSDFARKVADALGWKVDVANQWFEFEETKDGFFTAKLKKGTFLQTPDFRKMCELVETQLGGEAYLQGAKAWKVPGPYAKKTNTTSTPEPAKDARSKMEPRGVMPHVVSQNKTKPPDIPNIKFIPVDAIEVPNFLPTRELIQHEKLAQIRDSIKKRGLKYAVRVRHVPPDTYELIDGYLRLKAVRELSWKGIPAEIVAASDQDVVIDSIITNKDRIEEDPITVAKKLDILLNVFAFTQEKLAEEVGLSQEYVSNATRLLKLPKEIQQYIASNKIGFRHGLTLLTVNNVGLQLQLAKEAVEEGSTISELKQRIDELQPKPIAPSTLEPPQLEPATQARRAIQPEGQASRALPEPSTGYPPIPSESTIGTPLREEPTESKPQIVKRAFDVWGIAAMDTEKPFGDKDYPGNIPGDIVGNVLIWFLPDGGKVVDPMAGGGVTEDVCKFLGIEKYPSVLFDSKRLHSYRYRETIKYADVSDGKLPDEANNAALVFADPPYGPLKEYGMTINDLYRVLSGLAKASYGCLKGKGIVAVLMQNYYAEGECQGEFIPLVRRTIEIFEATGFKQIFEITVPLYGKVARSKISMTHIDRRLVIFTKVENCAST